GVSGIDGNIATAIGIAQGLQRPLIALLGDLAFLHDMNSLALLRTAQFPICLIVINNAGGAIFSFLPIYQKRQSIDCETFFAAAHSYSFAPLASVFNVEYAHVTTERDMDARLSAFHKDPQNMLIEIPSDREENVRVHHEIAQKIKSALRAMRTPIEHSL